ncbi:MAG: MliC family protein [Halioglobus sp.]
MKQVYYAVLLCIPLAACGGTDARQAASKAGAAYQSEALPLATTLVYDCNGFDFIARLGPGEMAVWLPDQYVVLSQVRSASGTTYEEGDITFWRDGENAMLTIADAQYLNCQLQPQRVPWEDARRRGVAFRAIGNEPGWYIEVRSNHDMLFVSDFGMQRVVIPSQGEERAGDVRVFQGNSDVHTLRLEILEQRCADTMSGEVFPNNAVVTFDSIRYQGCGQFLDYPWQEGP